MRIRIHSDCSGWFLPSDSDVCYEHKFKAGDELICEVLPAWTSGWSKSPDDPEGEIALGSFDLKCEEGVYQQVPSICVRKMSN
jgi:hypothetical protein